MNPFDRILVVDGEVQVRDALQRLLGKEGFAVTVTSSPEEAFQKIVQEPFAVVLAGQGLPGTDGVRLLEQARVLSPETVRILLAGPDEAHAAIDAINRAAVYWYLGKPWRDDEVRFVVRQAATQFRLVEEKRRLYRRMKRRYRNFTARIPDGIFIFPFRGGCFVDVNTRACEMTGYTRKQLLLMRLEDLLPERKLPEALSSWDPSKIERVFHFEGAFQCSDGTSFPAEVDAVPVRSHYCRIVVRDISERKRHEAQLVEARQQAEELGRLKSAFLANISHDIRTPLAGILGCADVLAEDASEINREFARLIRISGQRLMATLDSVLDLARLESGAMRLVPGPVDVAQQARETVAFFQSQAHERGLRLALEVPAVPVVGLLDRSALCRVLDNLIANALKFTQKGEVRVVVGAESGIEIRVEDTGVGISSDFLPHLFDAFRQESKGAGRSHKGFGLGLAITRELVDMMKGEIEVESVKGQGSTFIVRFPKASTLAVSAEAEAAGQVGQGDGSL